MTSKIIVNQIEGDVGVSSVTFNDTIYGNLEGNVTGNITGNVTGDVTSGTLSGISSVSTTNLTVNGNAYPNAGPLSRRNMCINGSMQVAQRGTSSTGNGTGTSAYLAVDRFQTGISNAGTWTISQSTDAPAGFSNSIKYDCTTAETSLVGGSELWLVQKIEAQNLQHLNYGTADAQDCTFSFYFKTNKTGVYTVEIYQADADRTVGFEMNVTQTGWQRYEFVIPGDTAGTINNDTGIGFWCFIWMAAGTNKTSGTFTSGSWAAVVTANRLSSSQVNFADSTSNECFLTGVQLETGSVATPFEHRSYADELARCQRYFQGWNATSSTERAKTGIFVYDDEGNSSANQTTILGTGSVTDADDARIEFSLPVSMREKPTTDVGDLRLITGSTLHNTSTTVQYNNSTTHNFSALVDNGGGMTAGQCVHLIIKGNGYFYLDAEL